MNRHQVLTNRRATFAGQTNFSLNHVHIMFQCSFFLILSLATVSSLVDVGAFLPHLHVALGLLGGPRPLHFGYVSEVGQRRGVPGLLHHTGQGWPSLVIWVGHEIAWQRAHVLIDLVKSFIACRKSLIRCLTSLLLKLVKLARH